MIDSHVLVLNRSFLPIHIATVKRAFCLLYSGIAKAVDDQYRIFDYESWRDLAVREGDEAIGLIGRMIRVPRVIALVAYDRMPKGGVRFSRTNIYARDKNTCQYCGKTFPRSELSIDHVIPRAYGGITTWENVVCCCTSCNKRKGGRTIQEAGMKLLNHPHRPRWTPFFRLSLEEIRRKEWLPFINMVDLAYWNTKLLEE